MNENENDDQSVTMTPKEDQQDDEKNSSTVSNSVTDDESSNQIDTGDLQDEGTQESSNATPIQNPDQIIREKLCLTFLSLKQARRGKKELPSVKNRQAHYFATVNFIDPTTPGILHQESASNSKYSFMAPSLGKNSTNDPGSSLNLYELLTSSFERDYGSTLHSVPYEHPRTGTPGNIERLPIRTVLTQSHGTAHALVGDAGIPWGGTAGAAAAPVSDPAEWHNGPYCHVYIAACEGLDHYRSKVRPSLQAFVSQIEGAANSRANASTKVATAGTLTSMNYSPHYVIVYVPVRGPKMEETNAKLTAETLMVGGNRLIGNAISSRLNAARKQMKSATSRDLNDSTHSNGSVGTEYANESEAPPPGPVRHSNKTEKEIFKKFAVDFPNGRACILSTLLDGIDSSSAISTSPLKNQEWNGFLRMLGAAIVSGFRDRCRRYDEELRRLDAARASGTRTLSKLGKGSKSSFDFAHFFLVKESLAFTYEQMQIPLEAFSQYDELHSLLPETSGEIDEAIETAEEKAKRQKKAIKAQSKDFDATSTALAAAADSIPFRKRLRAVSDFGVIEQVILTYLFSREITLLVQMDAPIEVLNRARTFVKNMHKLKCQGLGAMEELNQVECQMSRRKSDADQWALGFCWDVKCAADTFFTVLKIDNDKEVKEFSFSKIDPEKGYQEECDEISIPPDPAIEDTEKKMADRISEIVEIARLCFLSIGDAREGFVNPISKNVGKMPKDLLLPWEPWVPHETVLPVNVVDLESSTSRLFVEPYEGEDLLQGAFDSDFAFESKYLQITTVVARCNKLAGRRRLASRLYTEISELHIKRGDYKSAVQSLLPIVDVCANDGWSRCHFWQLFRLASCQRTRGRVPAYLNTLTLCFGPHLVDVAPKAAAEALQKDFESVVSHPQVATLRLGISSFLETDLYVQPTSGGTSSMLLNFVRKKLIKSFCKVGEEIKVKLSVRSFLPSPVEADGLRLLFVAFGRYEELFQKREMVTSSDAFAIVSVNGSPIIYPGNNEYECVWTPMSVGVFAISTVQMQWKYGCFHYDSAILRKPLSAIEVLPSDPTQSLELNPLFLIPGQIQQVRITFNSGSDIIRDGNIELLCSDGLQVVAPGSEPNDDKWVEACTFELPPCDSEGTVILTTYVKSRLIKSIEQKLGLALGNSHVSSGSVQTMQARVMTSYCHKGYVESEHMRDDGTPNMKTTLEAMVTTLDKPAFTVDDCRAYSYSEDRVLVTILLHCNTPVPFSIKEWEADIPKLEVNPDGDLNQELFGHAIAEGEQLSISFNCSYAKVQEQNADNSPKLRIVLQDEFKKTFHQVLPLDLSVFYEKLRRDEEYAGTNRVDAELTCSSSEGFVGGSVTLSIKIDASKVAKPKRGDEDNISLLYKIISDETQWIVAGKVKGLLDCSISRVFTVEFVGIPVHPGILKQFPSLLVQYESLQEDAPPMTVHLHHPDHFKSLSYENHMALACPAGLES
jgi:trafficking protein particle complex subunit 10